ncbi:hypothetical protein [Bacillus atrophaeus]|uniref:hypothetical protein n=1 Tax=Bacillus atrophaeus TaxID=1452 RepID=UPI002E1C3D0F|nr:hypothetical protein [Bacillus atrophaeus]
MRVSEDYQFPTTNEQHLENLSKGCLIEFVLETNIFIGVVKGDKGIYHAVGLDGASFNTDDEVQAFISGLTLGAREINTFTKEEAMQKSTEGYFLRKL